MCWNIVWNSADGRHGGERMERAGPEERGMREEERDGGKGGSRDD